MVTAVYKMDSLNLGAHIGTSDRSFKYNIPVKMGQNSVG